VHVSDAQPGLSGAGLSYILIDQLRRLTRRGNPARLADQFRHDRQYCAARAYRHPAAASALLPWTA